MSRRYLLPSEVKSALHRGKTVECFVGACQRDGREGIQWFSIRAAEDKHTFVLRVFETADLGDAEHLDLYEFGPLNQELLLEESGERFVFNDFDLLVQELEVRFPGSSRKLVNEGVVQDEYAAFKGWAQ